MSGGVCRGSVWPAAHDCPRGKPVVTAQEMIGLIRKKLDGSNGKKKNVAFPKRVWEEVMAEGFKQYPVGKLLERGTPRSRVQFTAPPRGSRHEMVVYHNMLVDLCQVGARRFGDLLGEYAAKHHADESANPAEGTAVGSHDDVAFSAP